MRSHSHNLTALMLCFIVAVSIVQTAGIIPKSVSAGNTLSLQLTLPKNSTESKFASGEVKVDLDSGHLTIQLKQAIPNSKYQAVFSNSTNNIQLGNFNTTNGGEGQLPPVTLSSGTYVGIFQILGNLFVHFESANTSFAVGVTTATSKTFSASTTSSSNTTQTTSATQFEFRVEPPSRTINAGDYARFSIQILANGTANVLLVAKGIPPRSTAIFTQDFGQANPEFDSMLIIVTSEDTSIGTYGITVISVVNGNESDSQLSLVVASSSTNTHTSTSTIQGVALEVSISPDHRHYEPNDTVVLQGKISDVTGNAVADASVSLQVDGPTGVEIESATLNTDTAGIFKTSFKVPASAAAGTYTAFASATRSGYASATTHTTFVIRTSFTPSVVIREVYTTDISGNRSAVFAAGQTVLVWVVVENSGATLTDGVVWVQVRDSNLTPIWIQIQVSTLETGQTSQVAFGFLITPSVASGLYTANALVSDKMISRGGTFLASTDTEFAVTS